MCLRQPFGLFCMVVMLTYYASMLVVQTLKTTMMAGPRTVGLGCFSPVQRLDERSEATPTTY
jgi:hypothetical protein